MHYFCRPLGQLIGILPDVTIMIEFKGLFLTAVILLFCAAAFAQDESRATATWQVQKYDINATLPQSEADRNLTVKAALTLKNVSGSAASTLTLRLSPDAEISAVTVNNATADFSKREEKINAAASLQRIVIRIPAAQPNGTVTASVDYKLNVKENSGLSALSQIGSQFLPLSYWYPTPNSWYFARGADYAPFTIAVSTGILNQTFISSGTEFVVDGGSEVANPRFQQKLNGQPFFVAGTWDTVRAGGVIVMVPKGSGAEEQKRAGELAALASEAKTFAANLLGPLPDAPLRIVSVKRGAGFSGGGTIFVDDSVFRRSKIDSQTAMSIAEGIVKIWLGNSVAVNGDGHGAIREGLSRYIATQFIEGKYGKDVADVERLRQRTAYAAVARRDAPLNIVSPLDDYYYPEVANKGAMIWRLVARKVGDGPFFETVRANMKDGSLDLVELRAAFSEQKDFLDHMFDQVTDTNLLVGLPQIVGGETKVALRNTGSVDATVNVVATAAGGEKINAQSTIRAKSFGEVNFKTAAKIARVEVDTEKLYPQTEYADDIAPKELSDSDMLLAVKRFFDKQDFANAEKTARIVLRDVPRFDDVRVLLARSLLALGRNADAEKEFRAVLDEKLPTSRSLAWANVGLGEIAAKAGQSGPAAKFAEEAILADAEYGASLAARALRTRLNTAATNDESVKAFFAQFDKVAVSNRKADMDAIVVPGEVSKFASGISGSTEQWQTQVRQVDKIDASTVLVETALTIKLLNKEVETGTAVYRLSKIGNGWKLSGVDIFEVR